MIASKRRVTLLPRASQPKKSIQHSHQDSREKRRSLPRKAPRRSQTTKVCSKARVLIHLRLNALVAISWVILLETAGIGRKIQGKGNIMPQLPRMMNPKENIKVLLMIEKIEKNITWFLLYPIQLSQGQKLG
jgi:hypothetical protein